MLSLLSIQKCLKYTALSNPIQLIILSAPFRIVLTFGEVYWINANHRAGRISFKVIKSYWKWINKRSNLKRKHRNETYFYSRALCQSRKKPSIVTLNLSPLLDSCSALFDKNGSRSSFQAMYSLGDMFSSAIATFSMLSKLFYRRPLSSSLFTS